MSAIIETASEVEAKANIFRFFARVFADSPGEETIPSLFRMTTLLGVEPPGNFTLHELETEYLELFVLPNPRYVAPYESVYRDLWPAPATNGKVIKGLLMGESTMHVRQLYLDAGVLPERGLPDHIANELMYLSYLWGQEATGLPVDRARWKSLRETFCREHAVKWFGLFREKVQRQERLGFYGLALQMVEMLIAEDMPEDWSALCDSE